MKFTLHVGWKDVATVREPLGRVLEYDSTGEAYDDTQSNENIRNGDGTILHCARERVVGLSWTWPVAVTVAYGALHTPSACGDLTTLKAEMKLTDAHVAQALALCDLLGYPVNPFWRRI